MDKETRQRLLVYTLAKNPWVYDKPGLLSVMTTSEATLQRDMRELEAREYRFAKNENGHYLLEQSGWETFNPIKDATVREEEILRFIGKNEVNVSQVVRVFSESEEINAKTVERALKSLEKRGLIQRKEETVALNQDILLPHLVLTTEEKHFLLDSFGVGKALSPRRDGIASLEAKLKPYLTQPMESQGLVYVHGRTPVQDTRRAYYARLLEDAASERRYLRLLYRRQKVEPAQEIDVQPLGIIYYWALDNWYLAAVDCAANGKIKTYALERMLGVEVLEKRFEPPSEFELSTWYKKSWGVYRGPLTLVKIRFYNDYAIWQRVKEELANRPTAYLLEDSGTLLLYDEVAGLPELAVWLRSFGPSAEVLEPLELRELVEQEWLATLALYKEDSQ